MKPMTAFRLTALTCVWFAVFGLLPPLREWFWSPLLTTAAILLSSMIAVRFKRPIMRLPFALLPLLLLWFAWQEGLLVTIVCAVPIIVVAVAHATDHAATEYWRVRREFLVLSVICGLVLVLSINPIIFSAQTCAYIGGFFLFGVLALRTGRIGSYASLRWQTGNVGIFALTVAAATGVGTVLMLGFDALVEWLKQFFIDPGHEVAESTPILVESQNHIYFEPSANPRSTAVPLELATQPPDMLDPIRTKHLDVWLIVAGVLLVIALAVLIWLLFAHQKNKREQQETLEMETENEDRTARGRKRRHGRVRETNSDKVRELYRLYLDDLRMKGVSIRRSETTHDISKRAAKLKEDDTQLRDLYRKARYGARDEQITEEELQIAEECYQRLTAAIRDETGKP